MHEATMEGRGGVWLSGEEVLVVGGQAGSELFA